MKKMISVLVVAVLLTLCLVGCGKNADIASYVMVGNAKLTLGSAYDDATASALGTPANTQKAVSCHYDGYDTMYYYEGYTIYTYLLEDKNIMYSIEITDASIKTPEGAHVGMTVAEVETIYGTDHTELPNGISYALEGEGAKLNFRVKNDQVFCIEYYEE